MKSGRDHVDLETLKQAALDGDARAQYTLAEIRFNEGNKREALRWLKEASQRDYPDACFTMATFQMAGVSVPYDANEARLNLSKAVDLGHENAGLLLCQLVRSGYGGERSMSQSNELLLGLAKRNHPNACCQIAALLKMRKVMPDAAETLLEKAAMGGSHIAAYIQAAGKREAALAGDDLARDARIQYLYIAARAGNRLASAELAAYGDGTVRHVVETMASCPATRTNIDFESIRKAIDQDVDDDFDPPEVLSQDNKIWIFRKLLTRMECAYVMAAAVPTIEASSTIHPLTGQLVKNPIRTSSSTNFNPMTRDCVLYDIDKRIAFACGTKVEQGEPLNVLYYRVGEEYRFHYDHLPEGDADDVTLLKACGQRKYTFIISMNDGYQGGETYFPELELKYRGNIGDALVFSNLHDDGSANMLMRHASLPVTKDTKWVASKWIREKDFRWDTMPRTAARPAP